MANDDLIVLGADVATLRVKLTTGADFSSTLVYLDATGAEANWPVGTTLTLTLDSAPWNATISGTDAVFAIDKADADAIADNAPATLKYVNGTTDEVWAVGTVVRRG